MKDEFEQKISRQPLRDIPGDWRAEILAAANASARPASNVARPGFLLSTLNHQISALLWPHPKAWAGLAAVWIVILAVNFSMRDTLPRIAVKSAPPSPEMIVELKKQQMLLTELIGAHEAHEADRPRNFTPKPRSERVETRMA